MTSAFIVTITVPPNTDATSRIALAEEIADLVNDELEVVSVVPWQHPTDSAPAAAEPIKPLW